MSTKKIHGPSNPIHASESIPVSTIPGETVAVSGGLSVSQPLAAADSFGRSRVSSPQTIFDSKQIFDNQPLFWDDQEVSGSGTGSTHDVDRASSDLTVSATTAGNRVRQTFQSFNYQPGKSMLVFMTFVLGAKSSGITRTIGMVNDDNGYFLQQTGADLVFGLRSSVSGSPVDTTVAQASWNIDTMDGSGSSGFTLDETKSQILVFDLEWLGVGSVRFGFVVNGQVVYCHQFNNANVLDSVYMSSPNLPLRYEIDNDGSGSASGLEAICASVIIEGGQDIAGISRPISTGATALSATASGTLYALLGIRLKTTHINSTVDVSGGSIICTTNDDYEWILILNPSVAGTFTYADLDSNSYIQFAAGVTANTVSGGTPVAGGFGVQQSLTATPLSIIRKLGASISGTRDTLVLCVRPLSANATFVGSMSIKEFS